jgi:hypothetical protein
MSIDDSRHLDKPKFRRGMWFVAKFVGVLLCVSVALSVLSALVFYRGLCPRDYSGYFTNNNSGTFACPFWEFYVRTTVRGFYGDPLP